MQASVSSPWRGAPRPPSLARSLRRIGVGGDGGIGVVAVAASKRGGSTSGTSSSSSRDRPPPEIPGWSSRSSTTAAVAPQKSTPHGALHRAERVATRRAQRALEAATEEDGGGAPPAAPLLRPYLPVAVEYVRARAAGRDGSEAFLGEVAEDEGQGRRRSQSRSRSRDRGGGASPPPAPPLSRGARRSAERALLEHHTAAFGAALDAEFEEEWAEAEARLASWPRARLEREGLALFGLCAEADGALLSDAVVRLVRPAIFGGGGGGGGAFYARQGGGRGGRPSSSSSSSSSLSSAEWEALPYHVLSAGDVVLLTRTGERAGPAGGRFGGGDGRQQQQQSRGRERRRFGPFSPGSASLGSRGSNSRSRSRSPAAAALASLAEGGVEAVVVETASRWLRVALPPQAAGQVSGGGWRVDLFANAASHERGVAALARFAAPAVSGGGPSSSSSSSRSGGGGRRAGAAAAFLEGSLEAQRAAQRAPSQQQPSARGERPPTLEEEEGWRTLWRALSGAVPTGGSAEAAAAVPPPWLRAGGGGASGGKGRGGSSALPGPQKQALQQAARARLAAGRAVAEAAAAHGELNPSQRAAVEAALGRTLTLWQGPPGTGKTATLLRLVAALLASLPPRSQLLVTAASNVAVDNIVSGLLELMPDGPPGRAGYAAAVGAGRATAQGAAMKRGGSIAGADAAGDVAAAADDAGATTAATADPPPTWIVRVGQPAKMDPALRAVSLDTIVAETPLGKRAASLRAQAAKGGGGGGGGGGPSPSSSSPSSGSQRAGLWAAASQAEHLAASGVLDRARVVAATCVGAGEPRLQGRHFAVALLDEAAQATEPAALVALAASASSAVLVGDQAQLPPTVRSPRASDLGLGDSLFVRLLRMGTACCLLDTQYRMHPSIAAFPSRAFYGGRLASAPRPRDRPPVAGLRWPRPEVPVVFLQVDGPERWASMMDDDEGGGGAGGYDKEEEEEDAGRGRRSPRVGRLSPSSTSSSSSFSYENRAEAAVVLAALQAVLRAAEEAEERETQEQQREVVVVVEGEAAAARPGGAAAAAAPAAPAPQAVALRGPGEVCVISPYAGQVRLVSAALLASAPAATAAAAAAAAAAGASSSSSSSTPEQQRRQRQQQHEQPPPPPPHQQPVEVRTVDGFQGREKELVVFSAVRSNPGGRVGFLSDARRLNVALTRARRGLVVVGDATTLARGDATWRAWLAWARAEGVLLETPEEVARFVGRAPPP